MAGPLQTTEVQPPGPRASYTGPLGGFGWSLTWIDYAVYSAERLLVVVSLIAMTVVEFVYILSLYITEQKIAFNQMQDPSANVGFPMGPLLLLGFVALMAIAAVNRSDRFGYGDAADADMDDVPAEPLKAGANVAVRGAVVLVSVAAVALIGAMTALLKESSSFYLMLTVLIMGPSIAWFFKAQHTRSAWVLVGLTPVALYLASSVPEGYSWADKRALFLLLWVGFLGASMAAKQWRHLKIDIARKLCPPALLPRFNGVSYLFAATFTGLLVYIGGIYLFHEDYGRFWSPTISGEIPDWLKAASIPVALLIIALRFGARGLGLLIWGKDSGLMPEDELDALASAVDDSPQSNTSADQGDSDAGEAGGAQ